MSRGIPETRREMIRAGYILTGPGRTCKGCGGTIDWWKTTNGNSMPFDPNPNQDAPAVTHWATCPKAKDFRDDKAKPLAEQDPKLKLDQRSRALDRVVRETTPRIIVALYADGIHVQRHQFGIPAEDLRHELITIANQIAAAKRGGEVA